VRAPPGGGTKRWGAGPVGVPLAPSIAQALWNARKDAASDGLVFPGKDGEPLAQSSAYRAIQRAGKAAGVPWASPHALRHTCGTALFRSGANAKQVQLWLGHHSPAFTLAAYVHLLPDDLPDPSFLDPLVADDAMEDERDTARAIERG
jgi:integrase